jgi:YebC/PmpR family DNA-binding regulatory protein
MGRAYQNRKDSMAKTSDQKARVYSKHARVIYVTAKQGGIDPAGNLALRSAIDRAKRDQVPAHVIDKAVDKAKGGAGEDFAIARYEGFGPGGCMVIVDCLTDNPNRTIGDVRQCFTKTSCKLGTPGSVSHAFDHCAIFSFAGDDDEAVLEALLMADVDVEDIESDEGRITVFAAQSEFALVRRALNEAFGEIEFEVEDVQFVPRDTATLSDDDTVLFEKFMDMLNDVEDVQKVYHNVG